MDTITIPKTKLKAIVKESMREVLEQELMNFRALLLPSVSQKEQKDIEKRYGKPSHDIAKTIKIKI
jgi:hypothetical protein